MNSTDSLNLAPPSSTRTSSPAPDGRPGTSTWAPWLLQTAAFTGFLAAVVGVLVAPGLRGLAHDKIVDATNRFAWSLAYLFAGLIGALIALAALNLSNRARSPGLLKQVSVSTAALTVALAAPALVRTLPTLIAAALAVMAALAVLTAAAQGLRAQHTRAVAVLMGAFAFSGLLRVAAWGLTSVASDSGNPTLYAKARGLATIAVVCEVVGQLIAAAWLGTRSRFRGQVLSSIAVVLAWILTWAAQMGAAATAPTWQTAVHLALATASSVPQPFGPHGLPVFLLASSILLAGVAAVQTRQVVAVVAALSFSLLARGAFDVPIHALAAAAAALWLTLAVSDERALWATILASRQASPAAPGPRGRSDRAAS